MILVIWFLFWLFLSVPIALIARWKGRSGFGWFFYALILPPVAFVHAMALTPTNEANFRRGQIGKCPTCDEYVSVDARKCVHCGVAFGPRPGSPSTSTR